jgi:hypothetical protein
MNGDDGCMMGTQLPPPPGFTPSTIAESLADGFESGAEFYDFDGKPVVLWPYWDYAEDWSRASVREIHPFVPILYGKGIPESVFREQVRALHGLE